MRKSSLLWSLALAGCASTPGYRAPAVQVPREFRETRDTVVKPPDSGAVYSDAGFLPSATDTVLTRLIAEATRSNLDVQAAEARLREARAARTEAALDFAPTVTFTGGYTRQRLSSVNFPVAAPQFPSDVWDAGFDAFWELDLFGRVRRNVQAQGAFVQANEEGLRDVQVSLTAELARAYFELRGAQERLAVASRNGANQRKTLQLTQQRLDAGRGTAFDTERARAQLGFTLSTVPVFEAQVRQAQYQIGVLVGRPPAQVGAELDAAAALPPLPAVASVASPDSIVRRRPDVAAAERQLAVQRALVGVAKADYLPRLTVGGNLGYSATTFDSLTKEGTYRYALGPVVTWPLLNLGRVKARVDQSRAREIEAQAFYNQTVLRALQEVETALVAYRTSRSRVEQIADAAAASERAADLARLRFSGGVADFLQVLDAERTQLDAQNQLAQSRTEAATAYAALYKALGGVWPAE